MTLVIKDVPARVCPTAKLRKVGLAGSKSALSDAASGAARLSNLLQICSNCGEEYLDESITDQLLAMVDQAAKAGVPVDIRRFVAA